ncbi:related to protein-tyrosine phosphatase [Phialocephala subalpina]|uniref:phosphatidylinositol-3,4,5-trisphosphate 3-phosphatase n=1 Tax=Phialocephala subalpina TaxID=576137 RepID=A0A1L7XBA4_9HELO|nr:related to protein-tyrosine phosphatase [Phialocephala subalpina]
MASLLRQIVAGPRSRHPEAGLDLCYVTDQIIATSGPSGTYPQRAYRNPLDQLVKFLDYKHGDGWAIWEFRAEGTGYPDEEVYGRIRHYPWPDHHPPPFKLVPMIMAGMRNWLKGGEEGKGLGDVVQGLHGQEDKVKGDWGGKTGGKNGRVVVVHCKAGKGRSGTMACSYLISECGWKPEEALARFTERRMRPGFGQGVSIPSQLRWVGYVDRWTKSEKIYVERQIEIMEVHIWGLRDGVKVQVEGFVDEGKTIKLFHVFTKKERVVVEGNAPGSSGFKDMISDMAGFQNQANIKPTSTGLSQVDGASGSKPPAGSSSSSSLEGTGTETGGSAVVFKPSTRVVLPTSDINIDFERRNKASMGWTMVTAVAHVWFNAYFEGNGPEQNGKADENGVFEIEWDKMDGIRGSSKKGTRAFDRLAVVWKAYDPEPGRGRNEDVIMEPGENSPVPEMSPADWKGGHQTSPGLGKDLGLRTESPRSAEVSKASSMKSGHSKDRDNDSEEGVRPSGPAGEEDINIDVNDLPQPHGNGSEPTQADINAGLDTASSTTTNTGGPSQIPTVELPGGVPEDQLKDAKTHRLGHLQSTKKTLDS